MTPEEACEKAVENFKSGMNCTQSVASVFAEQFGYLPEQIAALVQPFGGGMCRMREVCGTVSSMMFCLGMKEGTCDGDKKKKDEIYAKGQKLADAFKKANGSIICGELLGLKQKGDSPVSSERTAEYYKKRPCPELCALAAQILWDYLNAPPLP